MATTRYLLIGYVLLSVSYGLTVNDLLPFGGVGDIAQDVTTNVHNMFTNASLLDLYVKLTVPSTNSAFRIFGASLSKEVFINFNGHITFGNTYNSFAPNSLNETDQDIIAVYFSDNDLRRQNGLLHHRFTTNQNDLSYADTLIRREGFTTFTSEYCIVVTWERVKYYIRLASQRQNPNFQQENTYQLILCTDGIDGHIIMQYETLQWSRSQDNSTAQARAGWFIKSSSDSGKKYVELPNSGTSQIVSLQSSSNIRQPQLDGRWMLSLPKTIVLCETEDDGVYALNCSSYYTCCSKALEKISHCPSGHVYHPFSGYCVESNLYQCGNNAVNFCDGRADGRYENTATPVTTDYYRCKKQLTRLHICPNGISFNTGNPRCTQ